MTNSPDPTIGLIGCGRIGSVLTKAFMRFAPDTPLLVSSRNPEQLRALINPINVTSETDLVSRCDLVMLCVPPDAYRETIHRIGPNLKRSAILVSVTNAVSLDDIGEWCTNPVVKIIPSPAHAEGRGVCLVTSGPRAEQADINAVLHALRPFCRPTVVEPADSRIASNLAGCAPAIYASFCNAFLEANASHSVTLTAEDLRAMAEESVAGLAALLAGGARFEDVVARTATPGGTTEAAVSVLASEAPALAERMVTAIFEREAALLGHHPTPRPQQRRRPEADASRICSELFHDRPFDHPADIRQQRPGAAAPQDQESRDQEPDHEHEPRLRA